MLAVRKNTTGPGITVEDIPKPEPSAAEVLIKVKAAGICGSDVHVYEWTSGYEWMKPYMPLVLGHEFSGEVVQLGDGATRLNLGDRVVVRPLQPCGQCFYCRSRREHMCESLGNGIIGLHKNGGFAEYCSVPEEYCIKLPSSISFEEAALIEPLVVAANSVDNANVLLGDTAVFMGPGTIGLLSMLCAKSWGVTKAIMIGTQKDQQRMRLAKEIGADEIIFADLDDPVAAVLEQTDGYGANVVFEATGVPDTIQAGLHMLQKHATLVSIGIHDRPVRFNLTEFVRTSKRMVGSYGGRVSWERIIAWLSSDSPYAQRAKRIITHRFSFNEADDAFQTCISKEAIKAMFINR